MKILTRQERRLYGDEDVEVHLRFSKTMDDEGLETTHEGSREQ